MPRVCRNRELATASVVAALYEERASEVDIVISGKIVHLRKI